MKKFNILGATLLMCALAMNASPHKSGDLTQYSERSLGQTRVKESLIKSGRCPELCEFISDSENNYN